MSAFPGSLCYVYFWATRRKRFLGFRPPIARYTLLHPAAASPKPLADPQTLAAGQNSPNTTNNFLPAMYLVENDLPDQTAALSRLYYSSGGPNWTMPQMPDMPETLYSSALWSLLLKTPDISATENERLWGDYLLSNGSDGISADARLALFKLGMAKHPWMTPNTSYCSW